LAKAIVRPVGGFTKGFVKRSIEGRTGATIEATVAPAKGERSPGLCLTLYKV